jgi:hypothetical protein
VPSTVPAVKTGLRAWLRALPGLAGVSVYGAPQVALGNRETIILGEVTAPQSHDVQDWGPKSERPTLTGWVIVTRPGSGDAAEDAARDRAYALFGVIETALDADPSAGGVIPGPGKGELTETGLTENPADDEGAAARQAQVRFVLTWFSDFTP